MENIFKRALRYAKKYATDKKYRYHFHTVLMCMTISNFLSDERYLKRIFKDRVGYDLDLKNPKTYCEKLQWLKIHDRKPEYTKMVDKYESKKWVASIIGEEHIIPTLGVYNNFDEINFDELPEQFVLKCTHDSGGSAVCTDKSKFDINAAKEKLNNSLKKDYFWYSREWPYKNVKPKIIAEKYIDSLGKPDSIEYKLTCFNGVAKLITICQGIAHDSFDKRTNDHYDRDLKPLKFYAYYKNPPEHLPIPEQMNEIIEISEKLSKNVPVLRVDTYLIDGKVYFGEMTFYTWGGFIIFNPLEYDNILGDWIKLPDLV